MKTFEELEMESQKALERHAEDCVKHFIFYLDGNEEVTLSSATLTWIYNVSLKPIIEKNYPLKLTKIGHTLHVKKESKKEK